MRTFGLVDQSEPGLRSSSFGTSVASVVARSVEEVLLAEKALVHAQIEECISQLHVLRRVQEDVQGCLAVATSQAAYVRLALRESGVADGDLEQSKRFAPAPC